MYAILVTGLIPARPSIGFHSINLRATIQTTREEEFTRVVDIVEMSNASMVRLH